MNNLKTCEFDLKMRTKCNFSDMSAVYDINHCPLHSVLCDDRLEWILFGHFNIFGIIDIVKNYCGCENMEFNSLWIWWRKFFSKNRSIWGRISDAKAKKLYENLMNVEDNVGFSLIQKIYFCDPHQMDYL